VKNYEVTYDIKQSAYSTSSMTQNLKMVVPAHGPDSAKAIVKAMFGALCVVYGAVQK